jgi:hypothetical protein
MREDLERRDEPEAIELGAASELTQGTAMPLAKEGIFTKDFYDE